MAKELSCEILKDHFDVDNSDERCIKICEVKWNGRKPKGYDIRKYEKDEEKLYKGITISYDGFRDMIYKSIENGLVDLDEVEKCVTNRRKQVLSISDFDNIFSSMNNEISKYTRDSHGVLHDNNGHIVIAKRRKK